MIQMNTTDKTIIGLTVATVAVFATIGVMDSVRPSEVTGGQILGVIAFVTAGAAILAMLLGRLEMKGASVAFVGLLLVSGTLASAGLLTGEAFERAPGEEGPSAEGLAGSCLAGGVAAAIPTIWLPPSALVTAPIGCALGTGAYLWFT